VIKEHRSQAAHRMCWVLFAAVWLTLGGCGSAPRHGDAHLPNMQRVNESLYRGGQPTREGFARLHEMGIRTVVNVRGGDIDEEAMGNLAFDYHQRPMSPWSPRDEDVIWFLKLATDTSLAPVFLHCQHGADRSGYLVAMYRVVIEGWDRQRAIAEMTADGMGFHDIYWGLVDYVREADVEALRNAVGWTLTTASIK
jgi:protein tyrosine/serine phosphatase